MILVDTSVIVQFLRGEENTKVNRFETLLKDELPFGIANYTYAEVLQGARDEEEFKKLDEYLSSLPIYAPNAGADTFREAASLFYRLRKKGYRLRGLIDVLIALTAIHNNLVLLHNDKDYEHMRLVEKRLQILGGAA